jgi:hypothetical protein
MRDIASLEVPVDIQDQDGRGARHNGDSNPAHDPRLKSPRPPRWRLNYDLRRPGSFCVGHGARKAHHRIIGAHHPRSGILMRQRQMQGKIAGFNESSAIKPSNAGGGLRPRRRRQPKKNPDKAGSCFEPVCHYSLS